MSEIPLRSRRTKTADRANKSFLCWHCALCQAAGLTRNGNVDQLNQSERSNTAFWLSAVQWHRYPMRQLLQQCPPTLFSPPPPPPRPPTPTSKGSRTLRSKDSSLNSKVSLSVLLLYWSLNQQRTTTAQLNPHNCPNAIKQTIQLSHFQVGFVIKESCKWAASTSLSESR